MGSTTKPDRKSASQPKPEPKQEPAGESTTK